MIRKKRYFVLRKDIRSLCYYASREDLTLLGSIPLDIDTKLANVKPDAADGFQNVVAIETDFEDGTSMKTFIRFDTFEKMKAWMLDIKNEAQNMSITDEDQLDWWNSLFNDVQTIEPKTNASRRDGVMAEQEADDPRKEDRQNSESAPAIIPQFQQVAAQDFKGYTENDGFSDDDSDDESPSKTPGTKEGGVDGKRKSQASVVSLPNASSKYAKKVKHVRFVYYR